MNLNEYLDGRIAVIENAIAVEVFAGNSVKESNERSALAEIYGIFDFLRRTPTLQSQPQPANDILKQCASILAKHRSIKAQDLCNKIVTYFEQLRKG